MVVCSKCKGPNVQVATWVNPNTGEVHEEFGSWNETDTKFCVDCQEHVELIDSTMTTETEDGRDGDEASGDGEGAEREASDA